VVINNYVIIIILQLIYSFEVLKVYTS